MRTRILDARVVMLPRMNRKEIVNAQQKVLGRKTTVGGSEGLESVKQPAAAGDGDNMQYVQKGK